MKKLIITTIIIALVAVILYGGYVLFLKRTPETIIKSVFGISLKDFDYSVETFEEQWVPTGNGRTLIIYKFNKLTEENTDYLKSLNVKPLPMSIIDIDQMTPNSMPKQFLKASHGFYLYRPGQVLDIIREGVTYKTVRSFDILIIDTVEKRAVLYYQEI